MNELRVDEGLEVWFGILPPLWEEDYEQEDKVIRNHKIHKPIVIKKPS